MFQTDTNNLHLTHILSSLSCSIILTTTISLPLSSVLLIAAAGNGGSSVSPLYPASYKTVVSVAAVDDNEDRADFSETNDQVELSGPGVNVKSTWKNNSYETFSGTSMVSSI